MVSLWLVWSHHNVNTKGEKSDINQFNEMGEGKVTDTDL